MYRLSPPWLFPGHMPLRMMCPPFPPSPPSGPPNSLRGSLWKQLMPDPPFPPRTRTLRWSTKCLFYREYKVPKDVSNPETLPGDTHTCRQHTHSTHLIHASLPHQTWTVLTWSQSSPKPQVKPSSHRSPAPEGWGKSLQTQRVAGMACTLQKGTQKF